MRSDLIEKEKEVPKIRSLEKSERRLSEFWFCCSRSATHKTFLIKIALSPSL